MLVLHGSPESFDKDIVSPGALAIHADTNLVLLEVLGKYLTGELTALISVHNLWLAVFGDRFFECIQAKTGVHRDRDPMR